MAEQMTVEEKVKLADKARKALKKVSTKDEVVAWWNEHLTLGHKNLAKILLGRQLKFEKTEAEAKED